jgi:hypothetical protein
MKGDHIMSQQPNLVLIHAGTNDNNAQVDGETYGDAPLRLGGLIDYVLCQDPGAVVLVATLIQNKYNQSQTDYFNDQVPAIVGARYMKGLKSALSTCRPSAVLCFRICFTPTTKDMPRWHGVGTKLSVTFRASGGR